MDKNTQTYHRPAVTLVLLSVALALGAVLTLGTPWPAFAAGLFAPTGGPSGLSVVAGIVAEIVQVFGVLCGLYLTATIVFSLAQANLDAATGRPAALADAQTRIIPVLICFIVAMSANVLVRQIPVQPAGGGAGDAAGAVGLWKAITAFVIDIVLYSAGGVMAVGFALESLRAQTAALTGRPDALSRAWSRLVLVAVAGALTLASVQIANWIIQAVV